MRWMIDQWDLVANPAGSNEDPKLGCSRSREAPSVPGQ